MYKGLVTSGCSFSLWHSVDGKGWPYYLQKQLLSDSILSEDFDSFHRGIGGNGNMLIARNTIEAISRLLDKGVNGKDILCVVQWSGINRHQLFLQDTEQVVNHDCSQVSFESNELQDVEVTSDGYSIDNNGYYLMNSGETDEMRGVKNNDLDKIYIKYFQNTINDVIDSLWNWMTLQNYCEINDVKPYYTFMFEHDKDMLLNDDIGHTWAWKYLRDSIITDNVLPSITKYLEPFERFKPFVDDGHPSKRGHKIFSDYLKKSLTNI